MVFWLKSNTVSLDTAMLWMGGALVVVLSHNCF